MATLDQLAAAYTATHNGITPDAAALATLQTFVTLIASGQSTDAVALNYIINDADKSTALAMLSYQFFTGKAPTKAGLDYLTNSAANPNDLNDAYYAKFGLENRYINFSANLGIQGEGAAAFAAKYGAMTYAAFVASIYETIVGSAYAQAAGLNATAAIADIVSRQAAIQATAASAGMITAGMTSAQIDLAVKAATAGYLLGEAIKADVGIYASAANNFMVAVINGTATYGADVTATYANPAGQSGGAGQPVSPSFAFPAPVVTPPPVPPSAPVSHAFVLTTGVDTFVGESLDDTFTAILGTGATLNAGDRLDGAGGDDTLSITNSTATSFALASATISNIEHLRVQTTAAALALDLTGITGFTELVNDGSGQDLTFQGVGAGVTKLGVNTTTKATTVSFGAGALAGNADAITLTLNTVTGAAPVTIKAGAAAANELETLNIVSNGAANSITLGTDTTQTSLTTINISGSAPLKLNFASATDRVLTSATMIDAHAATGGVTIGSYSTAAKLGLGAANHTITLGAGANVVFFGFVDNGGGSYTSFLDAGDTVNATAGGDDTLVITGAGVTSANLANVTGVETMRFMNTTGILTQDVTQLPGSVTKLQVDGGDTIAAFTNLANNTTLDVLTAFQLRTALAADTGADTLTVRLAPATTAGATLGTLLNTTGATLETLNLVSNGFAGQTAANVITTDANTSKHVLTGSADLTITNAIVTNNFDASAFTGALKIIGQTATATTIKGGFGNDTITLGTGGDTVDAGAGDDIILLGPLGAASHAARGGDSITTGLGNDTIVFVDNIGSGNGGGNYAGLTAVTDFNVGASSADTDVLAFSGANASFQLTPTGGVASTGLAKGATAQGLTAGDAMVIQVLDATDGAAAAATGVSFFKLGTTSFSTNNVTTFANAIGTASVTDLAANGNYVVSMYDNSVGRAVIGIVNVGGSGNNDTTLSAADFVNASVAVVGTIIMTSTDYANFDITHLGFAY